MRIKKGNILVIENREFWKEKIKGILENAGYIVTATTNPQEGIELSKRKRYDLILLDYSLQSIKSLDVLSNILINDRKKKVVVTTTHPNIRDAVKYLRLGAFDYVQKSHDYEKIKTIVDSEIAGKQFSLA